MTASSSRKAKLSGKERPFDRREDTGAGERHVDIIEFDERRSHRPIFSLSKKASSGKKTIWREAALP
jgi:hypothetical protein